MKKIDEKRERRDDNEVDSSGNNGVGYLGHGRACLRSTGLRDLHFVKSSTKSLKKIADFLGKRRETHTQRERRDGNSDSKATVSHTSAMDEPAEDEADYETWVCSA
jgi:hypothetical protein